MARGDMNMILCLFILSFACSFMSVLSADPQRPVFHFLPAKNWMNDPNGLMYFNGYYHIFYQYNPFAPYNNSTAMHWGHAVSKDLVYWQHMPIALAPTPGTYDSNGVWSGSATVVNGVPTLVYTGISSIGPDRGESQNTAVPADLKDPLLTTWVKTKQNPVISANPPIQNWSGYRDPTSGWQSQGRWNMLVGSGQSDKQAMALLFSSSDYINWEYVHPLFAAYPQQFGGDMFECPDFYEINGTWILKASVGGRDIWLTGQFDTILRQFFPYTNKMGQFDFGRFYASKSLLDPVKNRRVVFGWVAEEDSETSANARGWASLQTLPREVILNRDHTISQQPIPELQVLRGKQYSFPSLKIDNGQNIPLTVNQSSQLELNISVISVGSGVTSFGLRIRTSPANSEYTVIRFILAVTRREFDLPGNDLAGIPIDQTNPDVCKQLCNENSLCYSWTYAPPGDSGPTAECFLKGYQNNWTPKTGDFSGVQDLIAVDRQHSTLAKDAETGSQYAPLPSPPRNLRVFVDHSCVEVYANDGRANLVSRIYPTLSNSEGVSVFSDGGSVQLSVTAWDINPIWKN